MELYLFLNLVFSKICKKRFSELISADGKIKVEDKVQHNEVDIMPDLDLIREDFLVRFQSLHFNSI
jgi:hypothetical protein